MLTGRPDELEPDEPELPLVRVVTGWLPDPDEAVEPEPLVEPPGELCPGLVRVVTGADEAPAGELAAEDETDECPGLVRVATAAVCAEPLVARVPPTSVPEA